jgi:hypothetical protein
MSGGMSYPPQVEFFFIAWLCHSPVNMILLHHENYFCTLKDCIPRLSSLISAYHKSLMCHAIISRTNVFLYPGGCSIQFCNLIVMVSGVMLTVQNVFCGVN